jgi:hypothetical protein
MGRRSAGLWIGAGYARLPDLEEFVDRFTGVDAATRRRMKIVASELFDNIVAHGRGVKPALVRVSLRAGPPAELRMSYRTSNFRDFSAALRACLAEEGAGAGVPSAASRRYDSYAHRYRGLGLIMCACLTRSICARPSWLWNQIRVEF